MCLLSMDLLIFHASQLCSNPIAAQEKGAAHVGICHISSRETHLEEDCIREAC